MSKTLARQLGKQRGFDSPKQAAYLLMQRAAGQLTGPLTELLKRHGLTESSYNVLRIAKGHATDGVASQAIGPMMVNRVPDVTRLVDRLVAKGLVSRRKCEEDRRVSYVVATAAGSDLLKQLDREVNRLHAGQFDQLTDTELTRLVTLLEKCQTFDDPRK